MATKLIKTASWIVVAAGLALSLSLASPARADGEPGAALLFEEALAAFDRGDLDKAIAGYQTILSAHPESSLAPRALINLARIFAEKKRSDEAHDLITRGREKYGEVPGLRDQLDALEIHLGARSPKNGKLKPVDKDKAAKKLAEAQSKIAELSRQIEEARKAGRSDEIPPLEKELAKLRRKLSEDESMKAGEKPPVARPGLEEAEKLRQEQERLISEAHALEDAGKVEEAFAMRRRADELAAQIEAARRSGPTRPNRPQKPATAKSSQKIAQARLAELRRERAEIEKARAEMESSEGMMESGDKEKELAERLARIDLEEKTIRAQMDKDRKGEAGLDKDLRKSMNEARKDYAEARKASQQARQSGDVAAAAEANARLEAATNRLRELRQKAESLAAEGREQAIERLRKAYKKQGLPEAEIKARLDFARSEQALSQEHQKAQAQKRAELSKAGQSEEQIRETLLAERQRFQSEAEARRKKHLAELEGQRRDPSEGPGMDDAGPKESNSDDDGMMGSDKGSEDLSPKASKPSDQKRKDESQFRASPEDQVMNRESLAAPLDARLAGFADKLRKRGLSESDVARRLELQQQRNEQTEVLRPVLDPKARAKKVANIMEDQARRIERLERELSQLRSIVSELRARLDRQASQKE